LLQLSQPQDVDLKAAVEHVAELSRLVGIVHAGPVLSPAGIARSSKLAITRTKGTVGTHIRIVSSVLRKILPDVVAAR
jgi:hypothetical protein